MNTGRQLIVYHKSIIIFIVLLITLFLRIYNISSVPPSPSLDEVSIGYNAYSLSKTGVDEYGERFPILLRAYDDFRPALYVYFVIPFIWLFDLSTIAVRFPSVILSTLSVLATYFLVKELFKAEKNKEKTESIAVLSTTLLAISPWHLYISRLGHEVNAGFAFFIFGFLFFLKEKMPVSALFLCLSFISYQTEKIFLPIFMLPLVIIYWEKILNNKKIIIFTIIASVLILIPFIKLSLSDDGLVRFKGTNIFSAREEIFQKRSIELAKAKNEGDIVGQILNNRRIVAAQIVGEGYISHFNPVWLFANSGRENHKVPKMGLLHLWEVPFLLIGIYILFFKLSIKIKLTILTWILIAPISSSLTTDAPHAMRSLVFLPSFQIISALGLYSALSFKKFSYAGVGIILVIALLSMWNFYKNYFLLFPVQQSSSFQYALHSAIQYVLKEQDKYNRVVFSNKDNLYQSYMFFLYNSKYSPVLYQQQGGTKSGGYAEPHAFGKYYFRPIDQLNEEGKVLYVGNKEELEGKGKQIKISRNLDGKHVISITEHEN